MDDTTAKQNKLIENVSKEVNSVKLPQEVLDKLNEEISRLQLILKVNGFTPEADNQINFINFVAVLPWDKLGQDILDLNRAREILNKNHYGLEEIKERILEYLSILILNFRSHLTPKQPMLMFVGLVGSGKTSLAYSIAESLGRPIVRIPFGGLGSALQLRGESRIKPEAEPGLILRALKRAGVKNPVILLDELDRVTEEAKTDIMGVLVELLDPEQNNAFLDHYIGFPFDLSQVLFIATSNNTGNIATAVLDRLEIIEMPFYSDEQKISIAKDFLLPQSLKDAAIPANIVSIDPTIWEAIVRPLGFDGGIRSLKRNINLMVGKIAKKIVEGNPGPFVITSSNINEFLQTS